MFIHFHQCSQMTNKTSRETDKHGVALHYTSEGQIGSQHLCKKNQIKSKFRAMSICTVQHEVLYMLTLVRIISDQQK